MALSQLGEGIENELFFARHRTCRNPKRRKRRAASRRDPEVSVGRVSTASYFRLPNTVYLPSIGANGLNALAVDFGLHAQKRVVVENALEPASNHAIAGERSIRNPPIHHDDTNATLPALPKEIGPDFRLRDQHEFGVHAVQRSPNRARQVEREVEDVIGQVPGAARRVPGRQA